MPFADIRSAISARLIGPCDSSASRRAATALAPASPARPSSLSRLLLLPIMTGPSSDSIQRTSSDATRCMVPRMAQVRTTERSCVRASSTLRAVRLSVRTRTDRTSATESCA